MDFNESSINELMQEREPLIKKESFNQRFPKSLKWLQKLFFKRKVSKQEPQSAEQKLRKAIKNRNKQKIKQLLINFNDLEKLDKIINNFITNIKSEQDFSILTIFINKTYESIEEILAKERREKAVSQEATKFIKICFREKMNSINKIIETQNYKLINKYLLYLSKKNNNQKNLSFFLKNTYNIPAIKNIKDINLYFLLLKYNLLCKSDITALVFKKGIGSIILISSFKNLQTIKDNLGEDCFDKVQNILEKYKYNSKKSTNFKNSQLKIYKKINTLYANNKIHLIESTIKEELLKNNLYKKEWTEYLEEKKRQKKKHIPIYLYNNF